MRWKTIGGTLYFEATRAEHPGSHTYRSRLVDGQYIAPELVSFSGKANDINPELAADGHFMIFASRDRGGEGVDKVPSSSQHCRPPLAT